MQALGETPLLRACIAACGSDNRIVKFYDELAETKIGLNRLPHWQQRGATFFVTYRLADSIPKELMDRWMEEKAKWIAEHPQPWDEATEAEFHRIFTARIDRLMDRGHGVCVLREGRCRMILAESFASFEGVRYVMHSWVAMPNHVHLLFTLAEDVKLETMVGGWKKFTARNINGYLGKNGALWQKDYFDRLIRDWGHFAKVARYIRANPKKAGLGDGEYTLWESGEVRRILG